MRVILREEVYNLGKGGEVVTVRDGYGRNYLLPKGLAIAATEKNVKQLAHERRVIAERNAKLAKDSQAIADKLAKLNITIERQAGDGGKLFGSVSTRDIDEAVRALGVTIDRKKIVIEHPIKSVGDYTLDVKLSQGVVAKLKVKIAASKAAS